MHRTQSDLTSRRQHGCLPLPLLRQPSGYGSGAIALRFCQRQSPAAALLAVRLTVGGRRPWESRGSSHGGVLRVPRSTGQRPPRCLASVAWMARPRGSPGCSHYWGSPWVPCSSHLLSSPPSPRPNPRLTRWPTRPTSRCRPRATARGPTAGGTPMGTRSGRTAFPAPEPCEWCGSGYAANDLGIPPIGRIEALPAAGEAASWSQSSRPCTAVVCGRDVGGVRSGSFHVSDTRPTDGPLPLALTLHPDGSPGPCGHCPNPNVSGQRLARPDPWVSPGGAEVPENPARGNCCP